MDGHLHPSQRQRSPIFGPSRSRKISCAECRRLKLKCSREWPCSECVRRGTSHLCPDDTASHGISKATQITNLQNRIVQLENFLQQASRPSLDPSPAVTHRQDQHKISHADTVEVSPTSHTTPISTPHQTWSTVTEAVGQLTWKKGGNSRFFGLTAADYLTASSEAEDRESESEAATIEAPSLSDPGAEWPLDTMYPARKIATISELMTCLPSKRDADELCDRYWEVTSWRFEPFTKIFFNEAFHQTYPASLRSGASHPHPHHLALVFAVLALSALFGPDPSPTGPAARYHACTRSALTAGDFLNDVSVASLCAMHLVCGYILNADEGPREKLYVLLGLSLRLAMAAGFHRDGSWWNMEQPQLDNRRRIWWELTQLERVHSLSFGLPNTLPVGSDTAKPSGLSPLSFLWWKWDLQLLVSTVVEAAFMTPQRSYEAVLAADRELRAYDAKLPEHLRCRSAPLWRVRPDIPGDQYRAASSDYMQDSKSGDEGLPLVLRLQQIRLAILYNHSLLRLHRSSFTLSLHDEPLRGPFAPSVLAVVVETSSNLINLVWALYHADPNSVFWASNMMDLFSGIACHAATLIRRPTCPLADHCSQYLDLGLELMRVAHTHSPLGRVKVLLHKAQQLDMEAKASVANTRNANLNVDVNDFVGSISASVSVAVPLREIAGVGDQNNNANMGMEDQPQGMTGMSNEEFDAWIFQFLGPDGS